MKTRERMREKESGKEKIPQSNKSTVVGVNARLSNWFLEDHASLTESERN